MTGVTTSRNNETSISANTYRMPFTRRLKCDNAFKFLVWDRAIFVFCFFICATTDPVFRVQAAVGVYRWHGLNRSEGYNSVICHTCASAEENRCLPKLQCVTSDCANSSSDLRTYFARDFGPTVITSESDSDWLGLECFSR